MAISKRLRFEILRRDGHRCRYCGKTAAEAELRVDHVTPVALGGGDEPSNLVASCEPCNSGKSSSGPDAPLVADVANDAVRWAAAIKQAAAEIEGQEDGKTAFRKAFSDAWNSWTYEHKGDRIRFELPADWRTGIEAFRLAGLPASSWPDIVEIAMTKTKVARDDIFRYCCGVAWKRVGKLQDRARHIATGALGDDVDAGDCNSARTTAPDFDDLVTDMAVRVWEEEVLANGREPQPKELESVRNSVMALYPDKVGSGAIVKAAYSIASWDGTNLEHGLDYDDYFDAEPFHVLVARHFLRGWTEGGHIERSPLTPERLPDLLLQAFTARDAGYREDSVLEGLYWAGRHNAAPVSQMTSAPDSYETNRDWCQSEVKECALSQKELDQLAEQEWVAKAERDRRLAERAAAGDIGWGHPANPDNAVTNAVSNETRHADGGA